MGKAFYVVCEVTYFTFSLVSRVVNTVFFEGSMHQTLSARSHIESRYDNRWKKREEKINKIFACIQKDHCKSSWDSEVTRARKTLEQNGDLQGNE